MPLFCRYYYFAAAAAAAPARLSRYYLRRSTPAAAGCLSMLLLAPPLRLQSRRHTGVGLLPHHRAFKLHCRLSITNRYSIHFSLPTFFRRSRSPSAPAIAPVLLALLSICRCCTVRVVFAAELLRSHVTIAGCHIYHSLITVALAVLQDIVAAVRHQRRCNSNPACYIAVARLLQFALYRHWIAQVLLHIKYCRPQLQRSSCRYCWPDIYWQAPVIARH